MNDRTGRQIKIGHTLQTSADPYNVYKVIKGKKGELCIENQDSPLRHYNQMFQWEIVDQPNN